MGHDRLSQSPLLLHSQFASESIKIQTHNAKYKILAANCMNPINNKLLVQAGKSTCHGLMNRTFFSPV